MAQGLHALNGELASMVDSSMAKARPALSSFQLLFQKEVNIILLVMNLSTERDGLSPKMQICICTTATLYIGMSPIFIHFMEGNGYFPNQLIVCFVLVAGSLACEKTKYPS